MAASRLLKAIGVPGIPAHHTHKQALPNRGMFFFLECFSSLNVFVTRVERAASSLLTEQFCSCYRILRVKDACSYFTVSLVQSLRFSSLVADAQQAMQGVLLSAGL